MCPCYSGKVLYYLNTNALRLALQFSKFLH